MSEVMEIRVDYVARVEGQAEILVKVVGDRVEEAKLAVFEPPRFFEAFMVGRKCGEAHEIASRICGICHVPHQVAALEAVEDGLGIEPDEQTRALRKLLNYANHISSHALSVYFLSVPDYFGKPDVISMASEHPDLVRNAIRLKKVGDDITERFGGRAIHPVTLVVNGFTRIPTKADLEWAKKELLNVKGFAMEGVDFIAGLDVPDFERKCEHIALSQPDQYAINEGRLISTEGLDIPPREYRDHIEETHTDYSWTKRSIVRGRDSFLVGPLARVNLNFDRLSDDAKEAARRSGFKPPVFNPFMAVLARAIELVNAIDDSVSIIENLKLDKGPVREDSFEVKAGEGFAIVEAPRGILYHNYAFDARGIMQKADVVTPTAHNSRNIERDLEALAPKLRDLSPEEAVLMCEMLVRAYDPCISCSVHLLNAK
jgi:coenzyme F420-reducing hydrogenase alpha subunit